MAAVGLPIKNTSSSRQSKVTVSVTYRGETRDLGIFDTWSGAGVTADNTKHRRGAMGKQVAVAAPSTIDDLTVTRDYDLERDHQHAHWLANAVGKAWAVATRQYLDTDGFNFGDPIVVTGVMIGYTQPDHDSDSSDVNMVELVINPNGDLG